jgi:uncharacterized lipoprotein YehR (DUF1307 family)
VELFMKRKGITLWKDNKNNTTLLDQYESKLRSAYQQRITGLKIVATYVDQYAEKSVETSFSNNDTSISWGFVA